MSICNFCTLKGIRARAAAAGQEVSLRGSGGWINIYVHPKGFDIYTRDKAEREKYFQAAIMALGDRCEC